MPSPEAISLQADNLLCPQRHSPSRLVPSPGGRLSRAWPPHPAVRCRPRPAARRNARRATHALEPSRRDPPRWSGRNPVARQPKLLRAATAPGRRFRSNELAQRILPRSPSRCSASSATLLESHRQIDGTRLLERVVDDQDAFTELHPAHASREIDDRAFERLGEGGCGWTLGGLDHESRSMSLPSSSCDRSRPSRQSRSGWKMRFEKSRRQSGHELSQSCSGFSSSSTRASSSPSSVWALRLTEPCGVTRAVLQPVGEERLHVLATAVLRSELPR